MAAGLEFYSYADGVRLPEPGQKYETWGNRFGRASRRGCRSFSATGGAETSPGKMVAGDSLRIDCPARARGSWTSPSAVGAAEICKPYAGTEPHVSGQDRPDPGAPLARRLFHPRHHHHENDRQCPSAVFLFEEARFRPGMECV